MAQWNVYVGTFTQEFADHIRQLNAAADIFWRGNHPGLLATPSTGIERLSFDDETGELRLLEATKDEIASPQHVALHPTLPVLYAAEFGQPGRLSAFAIQPDGTLVRRSRVESLGDFAVSVAVHPRGHCAYVAHWGDGVLSVIPLDAEGTPLGATAVPPLEQVGGPSARLHQASVTPGGNALIATEIGLEELVIFELDPDGTVRSPPVTRMDFPESSPRHVHFHPSGNVVYLVGERGSRLDVLEAEAGVPSRVLASYPSAPPGFIGKNSLSEVDLHPDGRTLYVGNRGSDRLTIFTLNKAGRVLTLAHEPCGGKSPRGVKVSPNGRHLLVANRDSGTLVVFDIKPGGRLRPAGDPVAIPAPSSIVFHKAQEQ